VGHCQLQFEGNEAVDFGGGRVTFTGVFGGTSTTFVLVDVLLELTGAGLGATEVYLGGGMRVVSRVNRCPR